MIAVMLRELRNYFLTPLGYVFMGLFLLAAGFFFSFGNLLNGSSYFTAFLSNVLFLYLFAVPLLTMRLMSEDRRQRTDQLLLTSPITIPDIVLGKFFAAMVVYLITLLVTALYAVVIAVFGDLAVWETVGGYFGFVLLGASFISIGVLVSALSESQVSAAFFTFFALLIIWFIRMVKNVAPQDVVSGTVFAAVIVIGLALFFFFTTRSWIATGGVTLLGGAAIVVVHLVDQSFFSGLIIDVLEWFSIIDRFDSFALGLIKLNEVVFYLSFTAIFLFLTIRLVEKRRWT